MDSLTKPYRECCLHRDPKHVYDLTGWDPEHKLYRLENDLGQKVFVRCHEFTPISASDEELMAANPEGKIEVVTVEQLMEEDLTWVPPEWVNSPSSTEAPPLASEPPAALRPSEPRKAKESQAKGQGDPSEAKAKVRELLAGCEGREQIAGAAAEILDETVMSLIEKYKHLDNGRFRMTIGNRMVGKLKKEMGS